MEVYKINACTWGKKYEQQRGQTPHIAVILVAQCSAQIDSFSLAGETFVVFFTGESEGKQF